MKSRSQDGFPIFKAVRWLVLAMLIFVIVSAVRKPASLGAALSPAQVSENAKSFEEKLAQMQQAHQQGDTAAPARFSADEVNSFIAEASARAPANSAPASADSAAVKSTQISFQGEEAVVQAVTERYGQDIYFTLRGKVGASGGQLTFSPTEFHIGRMSLPVSLINPTLQSKLSERGSGANLKLPDFISDLRVENGQLVVQSK
jgi:hypothetical protein